MGEEGKCPCNEARSDTWHTKNGIPQCPHSRRVSNERKIRMRHNRGECWHNGAFVGSPILVPELEEL